MVHMRLFLPAALLRMWFLLVYAASAVGIEQSYTVAYIVPVVIYHDLYITTTARNPQHLCHP